MAQVWIGPIPEKCDACDKEITQSFVNGATVMGQWAILCPECFLILGVGLGNDKGQEYRKDASGRFVKVAG